MAELVLFDGWALDVMTGHRFLDAARLAEQTELSSGEGESVIANFGTEPITVAGASVPALAAKVVA